jgi:uncharacterized protein YaaR (DUF327 family)
VGVSTEQFIYQNIVSLGLKDGDNICFYKDGDKYHLQSCATISIYAPTTVSDTKETVHELDRLLNEFGNKLMNALAFREIQNSSNGIAKFVSEFLSSATNTKFPE